MLWSNRVRIIAAVAAILAAAVILRFGSSPSLFERGVSLVLGKAGSVAGGTLLPYGDNERLKKEAIREKRISAELLRENAFLRSEIARLGFAAKLGARPVGIVARVTGREPSSWSNTVTIDAGTAKGIGEGFIATTGGGVAGMATACSAEMCKVRLLTDPASTVSCMVLKKVAAKVGKPAQPSFCIAYGGSGNAINIILVSGQSAALPGDVVETSGYGRFPRGLRIGVVAGHTTTKNFPAEGMRVKPGVDFDDMDFLLISKP